MHITCASLSLLNYIQAKLKEYGIETHIYSECERKYRLMCTNVIEMNKLLNRLYYEDGLFCLQRKYEKIAHLLGSAAQKYAGNKRGKSVDAKLKNMPIPR